MPSCITSPDLKGYGLLSFPEGLNLNLFKNVPEELPISLKYNFFFCVHIYFFFILNFVIL